jgi:cysteine synthase A
MSLLHLIGNTPIIKVDNIYIKCEFLNPTGSSKDRIAYEMLKYEKVDNILEVSSGNTGISVSFICSVLNKKCLIFCSKSTSLYKVNAMKAYGATVDNRYNNLQEAMNSALALLNGSGIMKLLNQFANGFNLIAQSKMAKEIEQTGLVPDIIICGIGTSGTLAGLYKVFPNARYYTPVAQQFVIEGISDGVPLPLKPINCNLVEYPISAYSVQSTKRYLAQSNGLWVGSSTAANFYIASKVHKMKGNEDKIILIVAHDNGWRMT